MLRIMQGSLIKKKRTRWAPIRIPEAVRSPQSQSQDMVFWNVKHRHVHQPPRTRGKGICWSPVLLFLPSVAVFLYRLRLVQGHQRQLHREPNLPIPPRWPPLISPTAQVLFPKVPRSARTPAWSGTSHRRRRPDDGARGRLKWNATSGEHLSPIPLPFSRIRIMWFRS
jgi:hypothetical protein